MSDERQGGFGTKLKINPGGGLTAIVYAQEIGDLVVSKVLFDMTGHDSPEGFEEKGDGGKRRTSSFDLKLTWSPSETTHAALRAAFLSTVPIDAEWESPNSNEAIGFKCHIEQLTRTTPQENALTCTVKIQPTGVLTGLMG